MPFDSFMTAALVDELSRTLTGLKVDRICQPERDEVDLLFHISPRSRLIINCTASTPYIALSSETRENPEVPPMMCMLLRKHLSRAKITSVEQPEFDRTIRITFDSGDEMGFRKEKFLYCEMMGRGSNLIFADADGKILAAFRQNDITTKFDRIVMTGMEYTPMPRQDKLDPMLCDFEAFSRCASQMPGDTRCDLFLQKQISGLGKLTAREISYLATGDAEGLMDAVELRTLWEALQSVVNRVRDKNFEPCLIYESEESFLRGDSPLDFSFMPITQFPAPFYVRSSESASEVIETYYLLRNFAERQKQHHNDIAQILKNCKSRLEKKIAAQLQQLSDAQDAAEDKKKGDLIIQEMYRLHRGDESFQTTDYTEDPPKVCRVLLDKTLTPAQNAQRYYKEYNKKKTAMVKVQEQIELAKKELEYAESVLASLRTATSQADLQEIRQELSHWNYGRRLVSALKKPQARRGKAKPREIRTENGFLIYVGMNNFQNDTVSCSLAEGEDLWFHVKNYHGSHVLLKHRRDLPFQDADLELAAGLAAYYSEVGDSDRVEVDYVLAKFLKKPNGSKPGFITYKNYKTAIVTPRPMK